MASLVISAVGAAVGYAVAGPTGAQWGWMLGSVAASSMVEGPTAEGPRLSDLRVQSSAQGVGMNRVYGSMRVAGNVIWSRPLTEHRVETEQSGGGKGGGGSTKTVQYTYSQTFAVAICEGPILGLRKIWMNNELIYSVAEDASLETIAASNAAATKWTLHTGAYGQEPDPIIEATEGVGNTPAYRDTAYIVFNEIELADYGNRTPNVEFEVVEYGVHLGNNPGTDWVGYGPTVTDQTSKYYYLEIQRNSMWLVGTTKYLLLFNGSLFKDTGSGFTFIRNLTNRAPRGLYGSPDAYYAYYANDQSNVFHKDGWNYVLAKQTDNSLKWVKFNETTDTVLTHGNRGSTGGANTATSNYYYFNGVIGRVGAKETGYGSDNAAVRAIEYSTDLVTWTSANISAPRPGRYIYTVHKGVLYAVGSTEYHSGYCAVLKSTDGMNWSVVCNPSSGCIYPQYGDPGYHPYYSGAPGSAVWSDGTKLFVIARGYLMVSSDDGATWTQNTAWWTTTEPSGANPLVVQDGFVYMATSHVDSLAPVQVQRIPLQEKMVAQDPTVADIVSDALWSVQMYYYNVGALWGHSVKGYLVQGKRTPRSVIEALQAIFYFDGVESDGTLKFVNRGGSVAATIPEADLAAHEFGSEMPDNLQTTLKQEVELPHEVSVGYLESESDYAQAVQYARRLTGNAQNSVGMTTAVALTAAKARQVAEVALWNAWMARVTYTITTSRKYAYLEPTDVIAVQKGSATHVARIISKSENGGVITFELVREDSTVYVQSPPAASITVTSGDVVPRTPTRGDLMDIPLLRDTDEGAGFYAAFSPTATPYRWGGAGLYRSVDGGATWAAYGPSATAVSVVGNANGVLGDFTAGNIFDEQNTVSVTILAGSLSSVSESVVLAGANMALLGDEIIQFKNATLTGTLTYTLSGILRGCRGTEWAKGTHSSSDRFVLLTDSTTYRATESTSEIGLARSFKAVTYGLEIASATPMAFTNTGASLKPLAPVHIGGGRDASGNLTINWTRRTRIGGEWRDGVDVQLGEAGESYDVDVMNGGTVVRTLTSTSSTVNYSAAQQTTDFGSPQSSVTVKVYQRSAVIGRGFPGTATI